MDASEALLWCGFARSGCCGHSASPCPVAALTACLRSKPYNRRMTDVVGPNSR
jgi:hypothetical protein